MLRMDYMPNWLEVVDATSLHTWRGLCLTTFSQFFRIRDREFALALTGGCTCCAQDWSDQPQAPPICRKDEDVYYWAWIITQRLNKQRKHSRIYDEKIPIEPTGENKYRSALDPPNRFLGKIGTGIERCTHALNQEDKN